ncbi:MULTISPECIES: hypothetical protein [Streptomyces]|uniref:hypothetical protein n=1 Tax=Streptomyces TaxID=1883 RepID=UPI00067AC2A2|nr:MULTISPECIES: hypothetical protein [Streptomyces]KND33732.1 hypothetical protein IQ60_13550 [Streptomyces europaeiscabiei]MDF9804232.1 hypothetical protein [Streptomyces sp. HB372]OKI74860.1 hypothetical protein AMK12_34005 [Streptomyces sp. TSRI0395]WSR76206.1 hypothetical protein OG274_13590 [Streptomyces anulatus]WUC88902.1 hypothetical protein OHQ35_23670 [Streptomyces anulatus]
MSFDEEWGALKAAAAMRLNQVGGSGGSGPKGSADYVVNDDELGGIGSAAFKLFNGLEPTGKHAKAASETAGTSLKGDGFDTGAAFTEVIGTWDKQVKTLLQACAHISNHLDYTKASRKKDDEWIETQLRIIGPVAPDKDGAVPASQINKYFR